MLNLINKENKEVNIKKIWKIILIALIFIIINVIFTNLEFNLLNKSNSSKKIVVSRNYFASNLGSDLMSHDSGDVVGNTDSQSGGNSENSVNESDQNYLGFPGTILISLLVLILTVVVEIAKIVVEGLLSLPISSSFGKVLFNEVPILDIDIFKKDTAFFGAGLEKISSIFLMILILASIIQIVILLILIIKYFISINATAKADIKESLYNWVKGIVIQMGILIFAIIVIKVNNQIVKLLSLMQSGKPKELNQAAGLIKNAFKDLDTLKRAAYFLAGSTMYIYMLAFVLTYIKRKIKIFFLLIISPAISATYALDMMDDKKSQAFDYWVKQFISTTFMQLAHILTYFSVIEPLINIQNTQKASISSVLFLITGIQFIWEGEKLINATVFPEDKPDDKNNNAKSNMGQLVSLASGVTEKAAKNAETVTELIQRRKKYHQIRAGKDKKEGTHKNNKELGKPKEKRTKLKFLKKFGKKNLKILKKSLKFLLKSSLVVGAMALKSYYKRALTGGSDNILAGSIMGLQAVNKIIKTTKENQNKIILDSSISTKDPVYSAYIDQESDKLKENIDNLGLDKESFSSMYDYMQNNSDELNIEFQKDFQKQTENLKKALEKLGIDANKFIKKIDAQLDSNFQSVDLSIMKELKDYAVTREMLKMQKNVDGISEQQKNTKISKERFKQDLFNEIYPNQEE